MGIRTWWPILLKHVSPDIIHEGWPNAICHPTQHLAQIPQVSVSSYIPLCPPRCFQPLLAIVSQVKRHKSWLMEIYPTRRLYRWVVIELPLVPRGSGGYAEPKAMRKR